MAETGDSGLLRLLFFDKSSDKMKIRDSLYFRIDVLTY
jgi:hypothetical protein